MDATRARLIGTLEWLSAELAAGSALSQCLRRLPGADCHALCAPLPPAPAWRRPWALSAHQAEEPMMLARIALAAGADAPHRLAEGLAQLALDLREAAR
jgi:hypothetical protein